MNKKYIIIYLFGNSSCSGLLFDEHCCIILCLYLKIYNRSIGLYYIIKLYCNGHKCMSENNKIISETYFLTLN